MALHVELIEVVIVWPSTRYRRYRGQVLFF
jgi:hypothetical protein